LGIAEPVGINGLKTKKDLLMRKTLLFLISFLVSFPLWAVQRTSEEALEIARAFFTQQVQTRSTSEVELVAVANDFLQSTTTRGTSEGNAFYVFNRGTDAYVIVSGDDRMKSVLAYSDKGAFNTTHLPDNLLMWMELCNAVYQEAQMGVEPKVEPKLMTRATYAEEVKPLLITDQGEIMWDQSEPYNNMCPYVKGYRAVTGCVATAMAQIMRYWGAPAKGIGTHSYKLNGQTISFDFGATTFKWDKMLVNYSGEYSKEEADAVAELMLACGVAVEMSYDPNGSGAISQIVPQALVDYFGYNEHVTYLGRDLYTSEEWEDLLKKELTSGRPVYYSGASLEVGHAFVLDGYDKQNLYHVNWGWSGMNNGYYEITSLDPENPGTGGGSNLGGGFVFSQGMIVGFQPTTEGAYVSNWMSGDVEIPETVTKGVSFNVTISEIYNMGTLFHKDGLLGLVAEMDGEQTVLGGVKLPSDIPTLSGYRPVSVSDCFIPTNLPDGTYMVYPASREARDNTWQRARGSQGSKTMFILEVKGTECSLKEFSAFNVDANLQASIEVLHNLYTNHKGAFRLTFANNSTDAEYYGTVGVAFLTRDADPEFLSVSDMTQASLKAGETETYEANVDLYMVQNNQQVPLKAGDYYVAPAFTWGGYYYAFSDYKEVTIKTGVGTPTLEIKSNSLSPEQIEEGGELEVTMNLSISGFGSVYSTPLILAIAPSKGGTILQQMQVDVFVETGVESVITKQFVPQVGAGEYMLAFLVYNMKTGQYAQVVEKNLYFTVTKPSAIEDQQADKTKLVIYGQPVDSELRFAAPANAEQVNIFASSGMLLYQGELSGQGGGTYIVPADKLSSGYYILTVKLSDGTMLRGRFIKR